jgi:hypothetical protein
MKNRRNMLTVLALGATLALAACGGMRETEEVSTADTTAQQALESAQRAEQSAQRAEQAARAAMEESRAAREQSLRMQQMGGSQMAK